MSVKTNPHHAPGTNESYEGLHYPLGLNFFPKVSEPYQIADGIYWICMPMPGDPDHINLWLLEDGDGWTIVDTGFYIESMQAMWEQLFEGFMQGKPVKQVIVTHLHPDHIGLAGWLASRFDCPLLISREEYMMCKAMVTDTGKPAPEVAIDFFRKAGVGEEGVDDYRKRFGLFGKFISTLPDSYHRLVAGQTIEINDRYWQVMVGSGHSPEHILLYCPSLKVVISGDQILPRETSNVSVMPSEPQSNPLDEWMASCARLRSALPVNVLVLPSHEEPFKGVGVRLTQLIEYHKDKLSILFNALDEPKNVVECVPVLFRSQKNKQAALPAVGETLAHLNSLVERRMVMKVANDDGVDTYVQIPDSMKFD